MFFKALNRFYRSAEALLPLPSRMLIACNWWFRKLSIPLTLSLDSANIPAFSVELALELDSKNYCESYLSSLHSLFLAPRCKVINVHETAELKYKPGLISFCPHTLAFLPDPVEAVITLISILVLLLFFLQARQFTEESRSGVWKEQRKIWVLKGIGRNTRLLHMKLEWLNCVKDCQHLVPNILAFGNGLEQKYPWGWSQDRTVVSWLRAAAHWKTICFEPWRSEIQSPGGF